jgi:hypothetical protein
MPGKPSRNAPCWCGSGKKYKRCHLASDAEGERRTRDLLEALEQNAMNFERGTEHDRTLREEYGIYTNYVAPVQWQGRKVWAIGSRVYPNNPSNQTFSEFLVSVLATELGKEWLAEQNALPQDRQHFLRRAYTEHVMWKRRGMEGRDPDLDGLWSAAPDGWTQYLLSAAFDVASLIHAGALPDGVLRRLRSVDQYQGARYELAVAAIFARLGLQIDWIADEDERETKHPEFFAVRDDLKIAVEAKSRHRPGVIHTAGEHVDEKAMRGDVERLYNRANAKEVGAVPFMVFIDVNAPPSPGVHSFETQWARDIRSWLPADESAPATYRSLCVTNFSPHYNGSDIAVAGEYALVETMSAQHHIPDDLRDMLLTALSAYGRIPEITETADLRR